MKDFLKLLSGGDLRSIGKSAKLVSEIKDQNDFDRLIKFLFHHDRIVVMRAADSIEKITVHHHEFLSKYKKEVLSLCDSAENKELKWHLALLLPRLHLDNKDLGKAWHILTIWAYDKTNSRIVRVNSIQGLFELMQYEPNLKLDLLHTLLDIEKEGIPSLTARIKKLKSQIDKHDKAQ